MKRMCSTDCFLSSYIKHPFTKVHSLPFNRSKVKNFFQPASQERKTPTFIGTHGSQKYHPQEKVPISPTPPYPLYPYILIFLATSIGTLGTLSNFKSWSCLKKPESPMPRHQHVLTHLLPKYPLKQLEHIKKVKKDDHHNIYPFKISFPSIVRTKTDFTLKNSPPSYNCIPLLYPKSIPSPLKNTIPFFSKFINNTLLPQRFLSDTNLQFRLLGTVRS